MGHEPDSRTYAAFTGAVVIGGANFVAVSFSNMELAPVFGATLRFGLAALLFLGLLRFRGVALARGRAAAGAAAYGLLGFGAAYALLYYALVGLSAGTTSVIIAASPLLTLLLAVLLRQERLTMRGIAGALLAIAGIAVLSLGTISGDLGGRSYLTAAIIATVAVAGSSVVARAFRDVHPLNMNAIGMVAGTILLAGSSLLLGESWSVPRGGSTLMAVGWLVLLGSVGLFQLFLYVMKRWTASATVYALAGMPVVAVVLGALMLDQPITLEVVLGGAMVVTAVYVGAISRPRTAPAAALTKPAAVAVDGVRDGPVQR